MRYNLGDSKNRSDGVNMSEDAHNSFDIEKWRQDFDRDMAVYKAAVKSLQEFRKQPVVRLTAEDCVFMRQCGIKVD